VDNAEQLEASLAHPRVQFLADGIVADRDYHRIGMNA
jgi:hypothetical protein